MAILASLILARRGLIVVSVKQRGDSDMHGDQSDIAELDLAELEIFLSKTEDPSDAIDLWVLSCSENQLPESLLIKRSPQDTLQTSSDRLAEDLFRLQCNRLHSHDLPNRVLRLLNGLAARFPNYPALIDCVRLRALALTEELVRKALLAPESLLKLLGDAALTIEGDTLFVPPGAGVALSKIIEALSGDGSALYKMRSQVSIGVESFDREIEAKWPILKQGFTSFIRHLFDDGKGVDLAEINRFFPAARNEPDLLEAVVFELKRRNGLSDGFSRGPEPREWLDFIAPSAAWNGTMLRTLLNLEQTLDQQPDALLYAAECVIQALWILHPADAFYCALTALRHARSLRERRNTLIDVQREEALSEKLATLPGGDEVIWLHRHCEDLPLCRRAETSTWSYLPTGSKGLWRYIAEDHVDALPELRRGFTEFLLTWTSRELYEDIEQLVLDLVKGDGDRAYLDYVASGPNRASSLRAAYLISALECLQIEP